jgi:hypothetical protein
MPSTEELQAARGSTSSTTLRRTRRLPRSGFGPSKSVTLFSNPGRVRYVSAITVLNRRHLVKILLDSGAIPCVPSRKEPKLLKALMLFHASRFHDDDPRGGFDKFASVGIASSDDWTWWSGPQ